jgi:bifunctional UDP-N-acetylglucosamine pyrophosphorylase / glucosamine-1-phosphate N-acetyltransferase
VTVEDASATDAAPVAAVVILAAGEGTRMKSSTSKLLHTIGGHSLLSYAIDAATALQPQQIVVVVGHKREQVEAHLAEIAPHVTIAVQGDEAYGTGYAVRCALERIGEIHGDVVVTMGDVPLLTGETLAGLVAEHRLRESSATILTANVADPAGYGRVIRESGPLVSRIVEHKDASDAERAVTEINSGIYVFDADTLRAGLGAITTDNASGELYLTDVIGHARSLGQTVVAHLIDDLWQTEGVNDRIQLARLAAENNRRILERWMKAGVTVIDPATTWIHASVDLAPDVTLLPGTFLEGATTVGEGATIGPDTTLIDVEVGAGATVVRTHGSLSVIGPGGTVGPFAYLRPGTVLGQGGKIGTFVETKNAQIGAGAKVPHLSYAGDAVIAEGANIGAGVIFANYDGQTKATSTIGRYSFVGSNSVLTAPVSIGDGAYVAAGSTITGDVGSGELGVSRARQRNVRGWVARRRAGTKTAQAAAEAAGPIAGEAAPPENEWATEDEAGPTESEAGPTENEAGRRTGDEGIGERS